jgi:pimeloyl-ACP methyl ester carboxylesterase
MGESGKASAQDWFKLTKYLEAGYDIITVDPRGQGETRMPYKAISPDDPSLAQLDFDHAYVGPLSGVLADYVYNSVLTGRPYFLQMIEDVEMALRFGTALGARREIAVTGTGTGYTVAFAVSETLPAIKLIPESTEHAFVWSEVVNEKVELWPIQFLMPGGAYIH